MIKKSVIFFTFIFFLFINLSCSNKGLSDNPYLADAARFLIVFDMIENGIILPKVSSNFLSGTAVTITSGAGNATDNYPFVINGSNSGALSYASKITFPSANYTDAITNKEITQINNIVTLVNLVYYLSYKGNSYKIGGNLSYTSTINSAGIYFDPSGLHVPNAKIFKISGVVLFKYNNVSYNGTFNVDTSVNSGGTITVNANQFTYKEIIDYINYNGGSLNF